MSVMDTVAEIRRSADDGSDQEQRRAPYVIPMAVMTLCYLIFELGFNARLLDVTGGYATADEISVIEKWGRILFGVALTLLFWGAVALPMAHKRRWGMVRRAVVMAISTVAIMAAAYHAQKALIDCIVDASEGATRRSATHLRAVSTAVLTGAVNIDGIDLSSGQIDSPAGKSFLALFPFIALSTQDLEAKSEAVMRDVLNSTAVKRLGTAEESYNEVFIPSVRSLLDTYNQYVEGNHSHSRAVADTPRQQERAWREYEANLAERHRGLTPRNVPRARWDEVRTRLLRQGLELPRGWNPADRSTFNAAVAARVRREADGAFRDETTRLLGASLPLGLTWEDFLAHERVQERWREALYAPAEVVLAADMGFEAYRDTAHGPIIRNWVDEEFQKLMEPADEFADGGSHEEEGRRAMESLVVPPIALAFSLLGALTHLFKTANYVAQIAMPRLPCRGRSIGIGIVVAAIAACPFFLPNDVSRSRVFGYFETQTAETFLPPSAWAARWVIQAQPFFYPVAETIRRSVLMEYGFGYEPSLTAVE